MAKTRSNRIAAKKAARKKEADAQARRDAQRPSDTAVMRASSDSRRPSRNGRPAKKKVRTTSKGRRKIEVDDPDEQSLEEKEKTLRNYKVDEQLNTAKDRANWNSSIIGNMGFSYDMKKNFTTALFTIILTLVLARLGYVGGYGFNSTQTNEVKNQTETPSPEWEPCYCPESFVDMSPLNDVFDVFDMSPKDDSFNSHELAQFYKWIGVIGSTSTTFTLIDLNQDGVVGRHEWTNSVSLDENVMKHIAIKRQKSLYNSIRGGEENAYENNQ